MSGPGEAPLWPLDLGQRAAIAREAYRDCRLCPRDCGVDRLADETAGFCRLGAAVPCYKALLSHGEEQPLLPTVLLDLGGCSLRCLGCTEWDHVVQPWRPPAVPLQPGWLGERLAAWRSRGARSLSLVGGEPSMHLLGLFETLGAMPAALQLPLVWNSNGLLAPQAFALLHDWVACWVIDHKVADSAGAKRLLGAGSLDYVAEVETTLDAIASLPPFDARSGLPRLIVRHLLVPGELAPTTLPLLQRIATRWPTATVNLMTTWLPHGPALAAQAGPAALRRTNSEAERGAAIEAAAALLEGRLLVDGAPWPVDRPAIAR